MNPLVRRTLLVALVVGMAACGGGGGGDDESAKTLRVTAVRAPALDRDVDQGSTGFPDIDVRFDFAGDLGAMVGRRFYVSFDDPAGLFLGPATLTVDYATGRGHRIQLSQNGSRNQLRPPGLLQGSVTLRVCYDPTCLEPVSGESTISVAYSLRIRPLPALVPPLLAFRVPFGDLVPETFVPFVVPPGATVERFSIVEPPPFRCVIICPRGFTHWRLFDRVLTGPDAGFKVSTQRPMPVGVHELPLRVEVTGVTAWGSAIAGSSLSLRLEVIPNPAVQVIVQPAGIVQSLRDGQRSQDATALVLAEDGLEFRLSRVDYLPARPEDGRDGTDLQWVEPGIGLETDFFFFRSQRCVIVFPIPDNFTVFERRCLAPGRYGAVLHFTNGAREVRLPIDLRVEGAPPPPL